MPSNSFQQKQTQSQTLKILPQQIQFLNLLNLNVLELNDYIQKELEENPFLEENSERETPSEPVEPFKDDEAENYDTATIEPSIDYTLLEDDARDYLLQDEPAMNADEAYEAPAVQYVTFKEDLKEQFHLQDLSPQMRMLCDYLIDSLDDAGFLKDPIEILLDDISFSKNLFVSEEELMAALDLLHQADPPGIGARNVQECLLLQLERLEKQGFKVSLPKLLIKNHMEELAAHEYDAILAKTQVDIEDLRYAVEYITCLNPKPLRGINDRQFNDNEIIMPDYLVEIEGQDIIVSLANSREGAVKISEDSLDLLKFQNDKKAGQFVKKKMEDANWLIDALKQRDETMMRTIRTIATLQRPFFLSGDLRMLRPMLLRDVAAYVDMDISTISRATSNKYVQTPFGNFAMKDLFTHTFTDQDGREVSNQAIQDCLKALIDQEDRQNPLNDSALCQMLGEKGFSIARRTVAKYREALSIPPATLRREA